MTQAQQQVNYNLLRLYIDTIPVFNGDAHTLEVFLEHCEHLLVTYKNPNEQDPINGFLIRAIIGKLSGNALMLIGSRPEIRDWNSLKNLLRLSFGDNRNLDCLVQEMMALQPSKNESFLNFGQRIQRSRSAIASKLIALNLSKEERTFQIKNYDDLSLKTFIRGLSGRVQDMVRLRNPNSLEVAISYVLEEENFMLNQKQFRGSQIMQKPQFNNVRAPSNAAQTPNQNFNSFSYANPQNFYRPYQNMPQNSYQNSVQQRFQFPSQPIDIRPRQNMPPPKYFTNAQVFGSNRSNVFKPTGKVPQNKPEPMSISTRNTMIPRSTNHFKPSGPRNFMSEELHNIDEACDNQNSDSYQPEDNYFQNCNVNDFNGYEYNEIASTSDELQDINPYELHDENFTDTMSQNNQT